METFKDGSHLIVRSDPLATLENCEGYYNCPVDAEGKPTGLLVGYTAPYTAPDGSEKKWVGLTYYNFSKADVWPAVLAFFAEAMAYRLTELKQVPTLIVGAPWAGVKFSQEVARHLGCRHIFAEKKGDELILGRYENEIHPGDVVLIGEELVNNTSTTAKLVSLIEEAGGTVVAIFCAINRSYPLKKSFSMGPGREPLPIVGVIERETPQYQQHDPLVADAIAEGRIVWKPKYEWQRMKASL